MFSLSYQQIQVPAEAVAGLFVVIGGVQTFFGYRLFRALIMLLGFCAGCVLGYEVAVALAIRGFVAAAVCLVAGLIVAVIIRLVYPVGLFIFGGWLGWSLAHPLSVRFHDAHPLVIIGCMAILGGVLLWKFERPVIILFTAAAGASAMIAGGAGLWMGMTPSEWIISTPVDPINQLMILIGWVVLLALGLSVQVGWTAKPRD
ncbi:DUF4203 domain-containing protein [bacterium]|nr:DUF4203 domain-containing protein [candidate division CSSED10-310 bacterium]